MERELGSRRIDGRIGGLRIGQVQAPDRIGRLRANWKSKVGRAKLDEMDDEVNIRFDSVYLVANHLQHCAGTA